MIHVHGSEGHMTESILNSTKEALGIEPDDTAFDNELVMHINSALMILYQLGVGDKIFQIAGPNEKWDDFKRLSCNSSCKVSFILQSKTNV